MFYESDCESVSFSELNAQQKRKNERIFEVLEEKLYLDSPAHASSSSSLPSASSPLNDLSREYSNYYNESDDDGVDEAELQLWRNQFTYLRIAGSKCTHNNAPNDFSSSSSSASQSLSKVVRISPSSGEYEIVDEKEAQVEVEDIFEDVEHYAPEEIERVAEERFKILWPMVLQYLELNNS